MAYILLLKIVFFLLNPLEKLFFFRPELSLKQILKVFFVLSLKRLNGFFKLDFNVINSFQGKSNDINFNFIYFLITLGNSLQYL